MDGQCYTIWGKREEISSREVTFLFPPQPQWRVEKTPTKPKHFSCCIHLIAVVVIKNASDLLPQVEKPTSAKQEFRDYSSLPPPPTSFSPYPIIWDASPPLYLQSVLPTPGKKSESTDVDFYKPDAALSVTISNFMCFLRAYTVFSPFLGTWEDSKLLLHLFPKQDYEHLEEVTHKYKLIDVIRKSLTGV